MEAKFLKSSWIDSEILSSCFMISRRVIGCVSTLLISCVLTACDSQPPINSNKPAADVSPIGTQETGDLKQKQLSFLNRLREADPQQRTIDRALLNDQNELGLILDRSVEMDKIPELMRTMLGQMAKSFPGEDITVLAYTPSNPPQKIGVARLNSRTRDMTYTPER